MALVGLCDDRINLSARWRYFFQLLTAVLYLSNSPLIRRLNFSAGSHVLSALLVFATLAIVVTAVINFTNFMDGLDGLVAGSMTVAIASLCTVLNAPWSLWALVGSLFGFLFWNWSPAKVFMGDVGSTFLGAVYAGLVLQASSWLEALLYLLVVTPILADAFFCILRRLFSGQSIFQAHRLHLFQRLHQAGWSHSRVSLIYILATALLALALPIGGLPLVLSLAISELFLVCGLINVLHYLLLWHPRANG